MASMVCRFFVLSFLFVSSISRHKLSHIIRRTIHNFRSYQIISFIRLYHIIAVIQLYLFTLYNIYAVRLCSVPLIHGLFTTALQKKKTFSFRTQRGAKTWPLNSTSPSLCPKWKVPRAKQFGDWDWSMWILVNHWQNDHLAKIWKKVDPEPLKPCHEWSCN